MKKFIVFMTSIITMMIIVASPILSLKTHAAEFTMPLVDVCEDCISGNTYNDCYSYSRFLDCEDSAVDYYAIYFYGRNNSNSETETVMIKFKTADVVFENNILTIENADYCGLSWFDHNTLRSCQFNSATLDFNKRQFHFYYNGSNAQLMWFFENQIFNEVCVVKSNIPEFLSSSGLNVSVDFTPDLTDLVVRGNVSDNGVNASSKYFSMDITNNSKTGIQYYFAIQEYPTNYSDLSTYSPQPESGIHAAHANTSQSFCNEEWIFIHPLASQGIVKVLKLSEWHYLASGESFHQNFSWSQFNLERGKQYQALVIAVPNDIGCASALTNYHHYAYLSQPDVEPYVIDMSAAEVVHFSNFSIANPVAFDRDNTDFGNYISTGDKVVPQYDTKAYEDPKTGSVVIANRKTSGEDFQDITGKPVVGGSHGGGGYYTGSSNYSASNNNYSNSFGSLNGYFSSYFGFISTIIGFFPSPYQVILTIGMCGLVVIGILKVAIK